jgi:hypothetical protein
MLVCELPLRSCSSLIFVSRLALVFSPFVMGRWNITDVQSIVYVGDTVPIFWIRDLSDVLTSQLDVQKLEDDETLSQFAQFTVSCIDDFQVGGDASFQFNQPGYAAVVCPRRIY